MKRLQFLASVLGSAMALVMLSAPDARACGGCFHEEATSPTQSPSVVTDHRMVLAITPTMTTLWDQVEYVGDPGAFAWVLPIRGQVVVGVGSDSFINSLDSNTAPLITAPPSSCAPVYNGSSSSGGGCGGMTSAKMDDESPTAGENGGTGWQEDSGVYVTNRSVVGPYETVQVHGKDAGGIIAWLRANKYHVDTSLEPMLQRYVDEGFDFVAVRLRPDEGVNAMRPIRVSFKGAYPSLPLRMVAAGVGAHVGIKLFVIGDGRWRTQNFPTQSIDPASLTWDFATQRSNYTDLRDAAAAKFSGRLFTLESSTDVQRGNLVYDDPPPPIDSGVALDTGTAATDTGTATDTADSSVAIDADVDATAEAAADAESDADLDAAAEAAADTGSDAGSDTGSDAGSDTGTAADTAVPATETGGMPDYDAGAPPMVDPYASDPEIAFGTLTVRRVTRLRADLPVAALDTDLDLEADPAQQVMPFNYQVTKGVNETCATASSSSSSDTCNCTVPDGESSKVPHLAIAGIVVACAFIRKRRK